jgi:hypothetical protein
MTNSRDALHDQLDLARLENHLARTDHVATSGTVPEIFGYAATGSRSRRNHKPQWQKVYQAGMSRATISGAA